MPDFIGLENQLSAIRAEEQSARQKKADAVKCIAHVNRILQAIKNSQRNYAQFVTELDAMLAEIDGTLKGSDIMSIRVDTSKIEQLGVAFKKESESQDVLLSGQSDASLIARREKVEAEIKDIKSQLGEKQQLFLLYKEQIANWERSKAQLQGDKDKTNTIAWYLSEIEALDMLPRKLDQLKTDRLVIVRVLQEHILRVVAEYRTMYQPVQAFVQSTARMDMPLPLDFNMKLVVKGFQEKFLGRINRQTRGSFAGIDESNQLVHDVLQENDFMDIESVLFVSSKRSTICCTSTDAWRVQMNPSFPSLTNCGRDSKQRTFTTSCSGWSIFPLSIR